MPNLYIYPKEGEPFHFALKAERTSIGRSSDNDIVLSDLFCSSQHAFISRRESVHIVRDNQSKNGVFLNGKKISVEAELKKGDEILLGSTRIFFDLKLQTDVEVKDSPSSMSHINTIMNIKEILKKPDKTTIIKKSAPQSVDIEAMRAENKDFSVISEVSQALLLHKPLGELLEHILNLICENLLMDRGILMLKEGQPSQFIPKVVRINNKKLRGQKIHVSQTIINTAVEKHSSVLISDPQTDSRFKAQESIVELNIQSAMCVPLWNNKEIIGIIYADRISLLNPFTRDDLRLLTLLSNLAAVKIENAKLFEKSLEKEKMEKELAMAAKIQRDLLPKQIPQLNNFEIAGKNVPCHQVGGDYYDFIKIDKNSLGIAIADVSGKGVSSSLLMASLRAALHSDINPKYNLEKLLFKLNNFVHNSSAINSYITFFLCELNTESGEIRYINAGHNPPFILNKKGKIRRLDSCGLCLGMFPSIRYEARATKLDRGEIMLLYTDGFTESRNQSNQEFKEQGLVKALKKNMKLSAKEIIEKIYVELTEFTTGTEPSDDRTIVIVKRSS